MPDICSTEKTLLKDVKFCQGKKSLPGTKKRVYIADVRDITGGPRDQTAMPRVSPWNGFPC